MVATLACTFACTDSEAQKFCARFNNNEAGCHQNLVQCGFQRASTCEATGAGECQATCRPTASGCALPSNPCLAVMPDDGKPSHGNEDIIGCRTIDGSDRCELQRLPAGAKVCVFKPGKDPCGGCRGPTQGTCVARRRSTFG